MGILDSLFTPSSPNSAVSTGAGMDAGGQIIGGLSHIQFGMQAAQAAEFQAAQMRNEANNAAASSQRQAYTTNEQTQLLASRALAVAAASGGGASDPTVVNTISKIASEGAFRTATALYQGQTREDQMNLAADAKEYEGKNTFANSVQVGMGQFTRAGGMLSRGAAQSADLLSRQGGDTLYSRYAGNGPRDVLGGRLDQGATSPLMASFKDTGID